MLPRPNRLTRRTGEIRGNRGGGKRIVTTYFFLNVLRTQKGHNRFAIRIPKGAVAGAVARHFWKRRIAVALRDLPPCSIDVILTLRAIPPSVAGLRRETALLADALKKEHHTNP